MLTIFFCNHVYPSPGTIFIFFCKKNKKSKNKKWKAELLSAVSNTENGKSATLEQQAQVLRIVGNIEGQAPPPETLLSDPEVSYQLNGCWYLQYTSPSELGSEDQFPVSTVQYSAHDVDIQARYLALL